MKKAERIIFTVFKVIYVISIIATLIAYFRGLLDPTATYCTVDSSTWLSLVLMTAVYCGITESEKKAKLEAKEAADLS